MKINSNIKEIFSFVLCVLFLFLVGKYFGFITLKTDELSNFKFNKELKIDLPKIKYTKNSSRNKDYRLTKLPTGIEGASKKSGVMTKVFSSNKKVIFYVYNDSEKDFHYAISEHVYYGNLEKYYNIYPYSEYEFKSIKNGTQGPTKISDSIAEFNQQRRSATDYSLAAQFFEMCGKTMCIFKPGTGEYARLRRRESYNAIYMIDSLKNW